MIKRGHRFEQKRNRSRKIDNHPPPEQGGHVETGSPPKAETSDRVYKFVPRRAFSTLTFSTCCGSHILPQSTCHACRGIFITGPHFVVPNRGWGLHISGDERRLDGANAAGGAPAAASACDAGQCDARAALWSLRGALNAANHMS